jgi:leucyl-tRNA synthetase
LCTNWKRQVEEYRELAARKSELERTDLQKEKTGVFSGSYAKNPATGEIIPIWVADYVLGRFVVICLLCIPMLSFAISLLCSYSFKENNQMLKIQD